MTRTRSAERTQMLHDVMSTALEGGVGYWSVADDIQRSGTPEERKELFFDWVYLSYVLFCQADGDEDCGNGEDSPCKGHKVTIETIASGIGKAKTRETLDQDIRKYIVDADRENDSADIDAWGADVIVQLGIFGDLIYG